MKIKVTKEFEGSKLEVEVEDSDDKKALMKALMFTQPDICGECKGIAVRWDYNKAQTDEGDFIYIKRICRKCNSQSTLGSYKGGGYFWKKWEKWNKDSTISSTANSTVKTSPRTHEAPSSGQRSVSDTETLDNEDFDNDKSLPF